MLKQDVSVKQHVFVVDYQGLKGQFQGHLKMFLEMNMHSYMNTIHFVDQKLQATSV